MKRLFAVATLLALTGCQGTPIGDAMIGPEKLAQMDDQYCRSIGAAPGTAPYMQCRMHKTAERNQSHQAAFRTAGAGLQATGAQMQNNAMARRPINCTSTGTSTFVGGPVRQVNTTCY
jgi:hypothetical protein